MKRISIFILLFLIVAPVKMFSGKDELQVLLDSAFQARLKMNSELNLFLLQKAEKKSDESSSILEKTKVYAEISKHFLTNGDFNKSKIYVQKASETAKRSSGKLPEAYAYYAWATYFNFLDVGDLVVENVQKAFEILDRYDDKSLRSKLYYTLYGVYSSWNDENLSLNYADKAIQTAREAGDYEVLANALSGKATSMEYSYRKTNDISYLDSVLVYLKSSKRLFENNPDKVGIRTYSIANLNIASYFHKYFDVADKQTQDSIIYYADIANNVVKEFDRNYEIRSNIDGLLAEISIVQGDLKRGEQLLLEAYHNLKTSSSPSYYALSNICGGLSNLYEKMGDDKQALFFLKEKGQYDGVFFNNEQVNQATRLEAQYENKRLLENMKLVKQKAKTQRMLNIIMTGITVLLLVILGLSHLYFKSKSRLEKEEQSRLKTEQELLLLQKKQMQKEAMSSALQIERKNELLVEMKNTLKELDAVHHSKKYDRALRDEMRIQETLDNNLKEFQDINPAFFNKLNEQATTKLTPLDLKYCAYIHLKLSTKEMAHIFNVAPSSIRVVKYRLKQKLNLEKYTDLNEFLQNI